MPAPAARGNDPSQPRLTRATPGTTISTASSLGAQAHYLDANLPAEEINRYADAVKADAIALSIVLSPVAPETGSG